MSKKIEVKTVFVKKIRKAKLPLRIGTEIDLGMAFEELKQTFDVRYYPESNFKALYVVIGKVSYCIFKNGSVTIYGNAFIAKEESILKLIWKQHLRQFVC